MDAGVADVAPGLVSPAGVEDEHGTGGFGPAPRDHLPLVVGVGEVVVDVVHVHRGLYQRDPDDEPRRRAEGVLLGICSHPEVLVQKTLLLPVKVANGKLELLCCGFPFHYAGKIRKFLCDLISNCVLGREEFNPQVLRSLTLTVAYPGCKRAS